MIEWTDEDVQAALDVFFIGRVGPEHARDMRIALDAALASAQKRAAASVPQDEVVALARVMSQMQAEGMGVDPGDMWQLYGDQLIEEARNLIAALDAHRAQHVTPIPMILHCPACGAQHIDAPEKWEVDESPATGQGCLIGETRLPDGSLQNACTYCGSPPRWTNPPHRSHLCHNCGHTWRPADVPTTGVEAIQTKGKNDSPAPAPQIPEVLPNWRGILEAVLREMPKDDGDGNAPGHAHEIPGVWDSDNLPGIAGQPCAWCLVWNAAKDALAAAPKPGNDHES